MAFRVRAALVPIGRASCVACLASVCLYAANRTITPFDEDGGGLATKDGAAGLALGGTHSEYRHTDEAGGSSFASVDIQ